MVKRLPAMRETRFDPWVGKIPWRRKWQPTPILLPGKFHGQRSLVGYSPWNRKELPLSFPFLFHLSTEYHITHIHCLCVMQYRLGYTIVMNIPNNKWYIFLTKSTFLPQVGQDLRLMKTLSQNKFYHHSNKGKGFGQWILALNFPTRK